MRQRQFLHKAFLETPKINEYSCSKSDLTFVRLKWELLFYSSRGSWCPLPRRANATTANAIATPIAEPYTATDASAIELLILMLQITSMFFTKKALDLWFFGNYCQND